MRFLTGKVHMICLYFSLISVVKKTTNFNVVHNYGAALLHIFRSVTFKSTTNSDTFNMTSVSLLMIHLNVSLRMMRKSTSPMSTKKLLIAAEVLHSL